MMAEQKGRSGKKPKYQIADIGGTDLTSQDISTERVLNFLIKGELGNAADSATEAERDGLAAANASPEPTSTDRANDSVETSLPSPETQAKKSLAHLFRRASGGDGSPVKDLKLDLGAKELAAAILSEPQVTNPGQSQVVPPHSGAVSEIKGEAHSSPPPVANEAASVVSAPPATIPQPKTHQPTLSRTVAAQKPATAPFHESEELAQLTTLWKNFYRLNDGEIDALSALYQMSHGEKSSECYIKMHKLAEMSNLTYRYCQKVVRSLEQLGWLTKLKDYDPSTQTGVLYRVNLKPLL